MSLGDIKRKLYQKEQVKGLSEHAESSYDPRQAENVKISGPSDDLWAEKKTGLDVKQKMAVKKGAYVLGGVLGIILLIVIAYFIRLSSFSTERMSVIIAGPERTDSGKFLTYEITYKNDNRAELKNAKLKVVYPDDFQPEDNPNFIEESPTGGTYNLGTIPGHGEGKIVFNGRIYSPKGALVYLKAQLMYNPGSFSSLFVSESQLGINVGTSPLSLEIAGPQNVASGDEVGYLLSFKNDGERELSDIKIKIDYPEGFTFSTSEPKSFEGNNIWYVGKLAPGQSGKMTVNGRMEGEMDQIKSVKAYIGSTEKGSFVSFNESGTDTKIVGSAIAISQAVNDLGSLNANAGDMLHFTIDYRNAGDVGLGNLIVTERIDSPVLDYSTLETSGGHFDSNSKTITWKSSDHPELRALGPNQGGRIEFSVKVKEVIPVATGNDKNFVISSIVKIDSPDIPTPISMNKIISGNRIDVKLNSKLFLSVLGFYNDPNMINFGPIPPRVGQETSYSIHWTASNINNDVRGAKVEAVLPTWAVATGLVYPEGSNITYNQRENSIVWEIGNMSAGTGILSNPKEVVFQVKIKPSPNQVFRDIDILKPSVFSAQDAFTGENISMTVEGKTTHLGEDVSIEGMGRVEQ